MDVDGGRSRREGEGRGEEFADVGLLREREAKLNEAVGGNWIELLLADEER